MKEMINEFQRITTFRVFNVDDDVCLIESPLSRSLMITIRGILRNLLNPRTSSFEYRTVNTK